MERRVEHLVGEGLAHRRSQRIIFARDLLNTLRSRELSAAAGKISAETGLVSRPSAEGEQIAGIYRRRIVLSSGRFAMIDDGLGFQLVPWRPVLEQQIGRQVAGVVIPSGSVDWKFRSNAWALRAFKYASSDSTQCYSKLRPQERINCNALRFSDSSPRPRKLEWG